MGMDDADWEIEELTDAQDGLGTGRSNLWIGVAIAVIVGVLVRVALTQDPPEDHRLEWQRTRNLVARWHTIRLLALRRGRRSTVRAH